MFRLQTHDLLFLALNVLLILSFSLEDTVLKLLIGKLEVTQLIPESGVFISIEIDLELALVQGDLLLILQEGAAISLLLQLRIKGLAHLPQLLLDSGDLGLVLLLQLRDYLGFESLVDLI